MLQTRASRLSIIINFWALIIHIYHIMITVTGGFSRISFLLLFPKKFLSNLELFLEFKHFYKTHRTSLFSFYLFIYFLLLSNHSGYVCSPLFYFFPSQSVQKRNLKALIWPPVHFVAKFNKYLNIKNLFACKILSENNNKQWTVSYCYKDLALLRVLFIKELLCTIIVLTLFD